MVEKVSSSASAAQIDLIYSKLQPETDEVLTIDEIWSPHPSKERLRRIASVLRFDIYGELAKTEVKAFFARLLGQLEVDSS